VRSTKCNNSFLANCGEKKEYLSEHAVIFEEILEAEFKAYKEDSSQAMFPWKEFLL
jgi:hypothetical protein